MRLSCRLGRRRFLLTLPPTVDRWAYMLAAAILIPIGYVLSAVPTIMALEKLGVYGSTVETCVQVFYAPLIWLDATFPLCRAFFEAEGHLLERILGK